MHSPTPFLLAFRIEVELKRLLFHAYPNTKHTKQPPLMYVSMFVVCHHRATPPHSNWIHHKTTNTNTYSEAGLEEDEKRWVCFTQCVPDMTNIYRLVFTPSLRICLRFCCLCSTHNIMYVRRKPNDIFVGNKHTTRLRHRMPIKTADCVHIVCVYTPICDFRQTLCLVLLYLRRRIWFLWKHSWLSFGCCASFILFF